MSLSINVTGMPTELKSYLKDNIVLRFNRDETFLLDLDRPEVIMRETIKDGQELMNFTIRKNAVTGMVPDVFWTPF